MENKFETRVIGGREVAIDKADWSSQQVDVAIDGIETLQQKIFSQNVQMGWWDNPREDGTVLALIHSEISECLEGLRKDLMDDHLPHRKMAEVELADALIRILDFAGFKGYDVAGAVLEKLAYNRTRADHQRAARAEANGKKF